MEEFKFIVADSRDAEIRDSGFKFLRLLGQVDKLIS